MDISSVSAVSNQTSNTSKSATTNNNISFSAVLSSAKSSATSELDSIFKKASEKYAVPESLLKAVAKTESNFNAKATSSCGAMGVMQLMPGTAKSLGVENAYDAEQNIMGGAKYLSQMLKQFNGDTKLALAAYNAGPGNVSKYGGIPPFKETQAYVERVMGYYNDFSDGKELISSIGAQTENSTDISTVSLSEISKDSSSAQILSTIMSLSTQMRLFEEMGSSSDKNSSMFSSSDSMQLLELALQLIKTKEDSDEKDII